jgi:translation initiation factor 2 subunit 3
LQKARQPELNIGTAGHIEHGKTTLIYSLTGKWAGEHSEELKRGITIRLGYADCEIRACPFCKGIAKFTTNLRCLRCNSKTKLLRKISFIDAPGHETLMATMLSGAAIIDGALLLIAADEACPQPQTKEHLKALEIIGVDKIVVVQNKIDLVSEEQARQNYEQIKSFVKGTIAEGAPIIPISAQHGANMDLLLQAIQEKIPTPQRDLSKDPIMLVARSFDVNRPGSDPLKLIGGVLGGALKQGKLKVGEEIQILPGLRLERGWEPILTKITSLSTGGGFVEEVRPGGSVGIATQLDPFLTKADNLAGSVVCRPGKAPPVFHSLKLEVHLLERIVGTKKEVEVRPLAMGESLMINAWTAKSLGIVKSIKENIAELELKLPVCIDSGERVAISRRVEQRWRLIGYGVVLG